MSRPKRRPPAEPEPPDLGSADDTPVPSQPSGSLAERYLIAQRAGGLVAPVLTAALAFFVAGLVVLVTTGKNPLGTYQAIFDGAGLNWLLPWVTGQDRATAAFNFQQTLLIATPLILTGLAVAFAYRCGLFNIGGQGQYLVGSIFAVWIGSSLTGLDPFLHILVAIVVATLAGAAWAGIAGVLKALVGTNEVISTIMLNWIAILGGQFLFGLGGPLQSATQPQLPVSNDVVPGARLPVFWGDPDLQGLSIGIFLALAALVVYSLVLNRTTLGYGVRAVGLNPEAARYGGIGVARNYFLAMSVSGAFAGIAGAIDVLGWEFHLATSDIGASQIGFIGIAVALLGRSTAVGVGLSALLFASLFTGTSTRNLDPHVFQPELASNLTLLIQGFVVLFVGADLIILALLGAFRRSTEGHAGVAAMAPLASYQAHPARRVDQRTAGVRWLARTGIGIAAVGAWLALPPIAARSWAWSLALCSVAGLLGLAAILRGEKRLGRLAIAAGLVGFAVAYLATLSGLGSLETVVVWSALLAAMLRSATPLIFAAIGGLFSERSGVVNIGLEGMMLIGAFFAVLGADRGGSWQVGLLVAVLAGGAAALVLAFFTINLRADQIVTGVAVNLLALGLTGYLYIDIYGEQGIQGDVPAIPDVKLGFLDGIPLVGDVFGQLNLMIWLAFGLVFVTWVLLNRTSLGLRLRAVGEHPLAAESVGLNVYAIRYAAVVTSGMLAAAGGAYLSIGFVNTFGQNMTAGRGYIALAALIFGNWRPLGAAAACLLFGFSTALAQRLPEYSDSASLLFQALPYLLTLIAVAGVIGRSIPPASVGRPYKKQ